MGLPTERLRSAKCFASVSLDDPVMLAEDEVAARIGKSSVELANQRLASMCSRMFGLPDQFFMLVHPESNIREWALQGLKCVDKAYGEMQESRARFWTATLKRSPLGTPIVREFFAELRRANFTVSEDIALLCNRVARSFISSAMTERGFQGGRVVENECHDRRMNHLDLWSKVVHDKILSEANGFSEIGTEALPSDRPCQSKLPDTLSRLSFRSQSMPVKQVGGTSRAAPYQTFTLASAAALHEGLVMVRYLKRVGRLGEASASWRASLLMPGMVVKWVGLPGVYMTFNARMTCVSLWPLKEYKVGKGIFWGLQGDMDCTKLVWRSLLEFKECSVVAFNVATPLRLYLADGCKLPLKLPPVLMQKRAGRGSEMSVLVHAARRGFQVLGVGVLDKVLSLECGLKDKTEKLWALVKHILSCIDAEVADILEVQVQMLPDCRPILPDGEPIKLIPWRRRLLIHPLVFHTCCKLGATCAEKGLAMSNMPILVPASRSVICLLL